MAQAVGAIGLGTSLAGGILSATGAKRTGQAQQQMYDYQAQVARINSQIDLQNRDYAIQAGGREAQIAGMKGAQVSGAIKTTQAASGLDVNFGSATAVQRSQRTITGLDLGQIRTNAAKTAYDYDVKSVFDTNQSTLDTMAGVNAKQAGDINATASILGTIGSVSSKWLQGSSVGLFGGKSTGGGGAGPTLGLDGLSAVG